MGSLCAVKRILLFPIKSLDGVPAPGAVVLPSGALRHDREFAFCDDRGDWINGKRNPAIHRIRARYDLFPLRVFLNTPDGLAGEFRLPEDSPALEAWLGRFLGLAVHLKRNTETGFPDDLEAPGPTVVSSATLREVGSWFGLKDEAETARRFRANIEIDADEPFWEDRLFGRAGSPVEFCIGNVTVQGINPCQRCAVPSRDPDTGAATEGFQRIFAERRERTLPSWSEASRFNHYYRLSVNTRIPASEAGKTMRVGDSVSFPAPGAGR
jgi:uncharacterized protein YcbX